MTVNEETYGATGAVFYDAYFPVDAHALDTAAFLAGCAREGGAGEPAALELGIGTGRVALALADLGITPCPTPRHSGDAWRRPHRCWLPTGAWYLKCRCPT